MFQTLIGCRKYAIQLRMLKDPLLENKIKGKQRANYEI